MPTHFPLTDCSPPSRCIFFFFFPFAASIRLSTEPRSVAGNSPTPEDGGDEGQRAAEGRTCSSVACVAFQAVSAEHVFIEKEEERRCSSAIYQTSATDRQFYLTETVYCCHISSLGWQSIQVTSEAMSRNIWICTSWGGGGVDKNLRRRSLSSSGLRSSWTVSAGF